MKKVLAALLIVIVTALPAWAEDEKKVESKCPKTLLVENCLSCHVVSGGKFVLRETAPDAHLAYPISKMRIADGTGYYRLEIIDSDLVKSFFDYLDLHKIKKAEIEVHSPGGPLFEGQRIVGLIRGWQAKGGAVKTVLHAKAFSGGFFVFVAGSPRLVDEHAELMWHEIQSYEGFGFKISTPSDKEDDARIFRHLQDVLHEYLATRCKLTKEEIDAKVNKRQEWWMSGKQAVGYGFADGFIGKQ
ncbi:MAG: ATP-dependent Clp protease proteolytic subunit [Pseudomonadota bacterium]